MDGGPFQLPVAVGPVTVCATGHDHPAFIVYRRKNGQCLLDPFALCRGYLI